MSSWMVISLEFVVAVVGARGQEGTHEGSVGQGELVSGVL